MRAHSSLRLGSLRRTTPELLVSPWYCAWGFCVVWEAGLPHKTSSPPTQRRNGRACSSLTARGGGLPVGVIDRLEYFIARRIGPAKACDLGRGLRVEGLLQHGVERPCPQTAPVHWREDLHIANRMQAKALGNAL